MNKIKINGESDFLPDLELLSFWRHTATSEERLQRLELCSEGTALLRMRRGSPSAPGDRSGIELEGEHILVCTERARIPAASAQFNSFWKIFLACVVYAFRVPFLSMGLVQTH